MDRARPPPPPARPARDGVLEAVNADLQNGRRHQGPFAEAAQHALEGASMELGLAVASMGAARHLALQGCAPCPSAPLDSMDDLAGDHGVWYALEKLANADGLATRVHNGVELACGHLRAAEVLLVLDEASDGDEQSPSCEQLIGVMVLSEAMLKAADLATETAEAREAAFGFICGIK